MVLCIKDITLINSHERHYLDQATLVVEGIECSLRYDIMLWLNIEDANQHSRTHS